MARLILAIIAFVLALAVIKMVIIALVIAGLIFRTRVTVGLLMLGGALTFIAAFPVIGIALLIAAAIAGLVKLAKSGPVDRKAALLDDPDQE